MKDHFIIDREKQYLLINGVKVHSGNYSVVKVLLRGETTDTGEQLHAFLTEWFDHSPTLSVQTSGSTGIPKELVVEKERMIQSAMMTCSYLGIKQEERALLCMSLQYIGAKMMVVRALVTGMELVIYTPSGHPLKKDPGIIDLAAMVPLQVYNTLQIPEEKERLQNIRNLLIGGSSINNILEKELTELPGNIYSTYGMTETLSHIALRQLNGFTPQPYYYPLPGVWISLSKDNTLIVDAPLIHETPLETNDIAEIFPDDGFIIKGRKDNVINTGGIKIQIEEVERKLASVIFTPFAITSIPDPKFGEVIVLLIEKPIGISAITTLLTQKLSLYEQPKHILSVDKIPCTNNNKIDRKACKIYAISSLIFL